MGPQIIADYRDFPLGGASSVGLGNFDGVHLGHQEIIKTCLVGAKRNDMTSVAFTFHPHPTRILIPHRSPQLLLTLDERREILGLMGVDRIVEQNFTKEFSQISADTFIDEILFRTINAKSVVVGSNFRFGFGATGNPDLLKSKSYFETKVIESVTTSKGEPISSSRIRDLIQAGNIEGANDCLGYPFFLTGRVISGEKRGRSLGFPTANLETEKECLPGRGVYLTICQDLVSRNFFASLTNVGLRPTVSHDSRLSLESHLIDFQDDLYGRSMRIFFLRRLRDEMRFEGVAQLRHQIEKDVQRSKSLFMSMNFLHTSVTSSVLSVKMPSRSIQGFQPFERIERIDSF